MTVTLELANAATDVSTRRTLSELSLAVAKSKRIVVVTGAGISCSSGIPDFRSSDGLYALVKGRFPDVVMKGRDLFDASLFRDPTSTAVFYSFIAGLKRAIDDATPSPTHHFIKTLDTKKRLLRSYTQNIDGFEGHVGLLSSSSESAKTNGKGKTKIRTKDVRNVQLHGDIHRVRCMACCAEYPCSEEHLTTFERGEAPDCPDCVSRSEARVARSARALRVGTLRPAIVLYDETHPLGDDIGAIHSNDLTKKPDMLIIMGTSLKVHGLRKLVKDFARTIHGSAPGSPSSSTKPPFKVIFVNKTAPSNEWSDIIDYHVAGDTDSWTARVVEEWKKKRPADWEVQQTLVPAGEGSPFTLKTVKTTAATTGKGSKPKKPAPGPENVAPPAVEEELPPRPKSTVPPPSPSKRRQKASHYDNLEASPSKRHSTSAVHPALPGEERKLLFQESTNKAVVQIAGEKSKTDMDLSLCDLSMRDAFGDVDKVLEASRMDISICNVSMQDASILVVPSKPRAKRVTKKLPSKRSAVPKSTRVVEVEIIKRELRATQKPKAVS